VVSRIEGLSGNFDNGEWKADIVLRGDYTGILTDDGRDQPILMHVVHFWDGVADTFGGYVRHNNTFVLMCREAELHVKSTKEYETILHMETPAYTLKRRWLEELKFSDTPVAGTYSSANLTASDVIYLLMRTATNLADYFNVSVWNNNADLPTGETFIIHQGANLWEAIRDTAGWNFGIVWFDRWGSLLIKPDPRARKTDWDAISADVYDASNPLTTAHMLEYRLVRNRVVNVASLSIQAKLPGGEVRNYATANEGYLGDFLEMDGFIAPASGDMGTWAVFYLNAQNVEYSLDCMLPMGHELNPGDTLVVDDINPPIGDTFAASAHAWLATDINYEFDFTRGFWVRRLFLQMLPTGGA
jgi:hypothetical protein